MRALKRHFRNGPLLPVRRAAPLESTVSRVCRSIPTGDMASATPERLGISADATAGRSLAEATKLAHLPEETAIQRMASLIVALPGGPAVHPATIAVRLIALLLRGTRSNMPSRQALLGVSSASNFRVAIYVIFMFFVLGTQSIIISRQSPARVESAQAPVSSTVLPQVPLRTFWPVTISSAGAIGERL